jgi:hypothetical protein
VVAVSLLDWYFLPVANPDGYAHTMSNGTNFDKIKSNILFFCGGEFS